MKMTKYIVIAAAAALTVGGVIAFEARATETDSGTVRRPFHGQFLQRAKEKLGLTDDQVAQIKSQLAPEKDTLKALITKLHEARVGLREAIQAPDATEASVRAASAKVASVQADLAVERLKLFGKLSPILTPEQREKVKRFQARLDQLLNKATKKFGEKGSSE